MAAAVAISERLAALLGPALGGPGRAASGLPRGVVEYSYYLFRDWGWIGPDARNARAFDACVGRPGDLGRLLVLEPGLRVSYDLHRCCGVPRPPWSDIDP